MKCHPRSTGCSSQIRPRSYMLGVVMAVSGEGPFSTRLRHVMFGTLFLALSLAGCSGGGSSSLTPVTAAPTSASFDKASAAAQRHTRLTVSLPGDGPNPCLADPISCGTGAGCDASLSNCNEHGLNYPPPSDVGGGGGGGDLIPPPSSDTTRPKTNDEKFCNATGGVFYTDPDGTTHCQRNGDAAAIFKVPGCTGMTVLLNTNGTGGRVYFGFPLNLIFDSVPFGPRGGVAVQSNCGFDTY